MPPLLATLLTLLFIAFLFRNDSKEGYAPSLALMLPCLWMFILGSRSVSEWLYLGTPMAGGDIAEGSPLDRAVFFMMMGVGFLVLLKRRLNWSQVFRQNIALLMFLLYCGLTIVWSDFPFVAFKRWFKAFGDPIMVLIVLTEPDPLKAAQTVVRVCTNLLVPLSVLFIKYYPHLGRTYSEWTGGATYTGVTTNKNILGFTLMVFSLFLVWRIYTHWTKKSGNKLRNLGVPVLLLTMIVWLFQMADSKTPLLSLSLAICIFLALRMKPIRKYVTALVVVGLIAFATLQFTMDIKTSIAEGAGRDATFTGRTELWEVVLQMQEHPILGYGFDTFWLGDRLRNLQARWYFKPTQAHSGYIEMYLNLGLVGWAFFLCVILSYYRKTRANLASGERDAEQVVFARLGLAFLFAYLAYNYTEAAFKTPHFLFVIFLIFGMKASRSAQRVYEAVFPAVARTGRLVPSGPTKPALS